MPHPNLPAGENKDALDAALEDLRVPVAVILADGDEPTEILALGTLVRCSAPKSADLVRLRDGLTNSTLSEVVGDVAFSLGATDAEDDEQEIDAEDRP